MTLLSDNRGDLGPESGSERRSRDPVARLSRRMDRECRNAVDPFEIAARLEASGFNDDSVRKRYQVADVFTLGEMLFEIVPRTVAPAPEPVGTSRREKLRLLTRGLLYALPACLSLLLLPTVSQSASDAAILVVSLITGWSAGQAIAFLGYTRLNDGEVADARAVLRRAGLATAGISAIVFVSVAAFRWVGVPAATLALLQVVYFSAATVLLTLKQELKLLLCFVPVVGAALFAAIGGPGLLPGLVIALVGLGLMLAVGFAYVATRNDPLVEIGPVLGGRDLFAAAPYFGLGLSYACLVAVAIAQWSMYSRAVSAPGFDLLMLPLIASTAAGEWQLENFRQRSVIQLHSAVSTAEFRSSMRMIVIRSVWAYVGFLAMLSTAAAAYLLVRGSLTAVDALRLTSYGLLGSAFFVGLLLVAHGYVRDVIIVTGPVCAAMVAATALRVGAGGVGPFVLLGLASGVMVALLLRLALDRLSNVFCHR